MSTSEPSETTLARLRLLVIRPEGPDVVFLLGAGASVKSGVPPAAQVAEMALRRAYCRENGHSDDDPRVVRSDWMTWAEGLEWFNRDAPLADQYPAILERLLQPREERREFFLKLLGQRTQPSKGYVALADLVFKGWVKTILTTNFEELAFEACRATPMPWIQIVRTPSEAGLISTAPAYPQVIHLHGSVEHYTDQNIESETRSCHPSLRVQVVPLLRDHPLVVIGYRGAEPSIMADLLAEGARDGNYRRGMFWCVRDSEALHPNVQQLASQLGANFQLVRVGGFDECMAELNREVSARPRVTVDPSMTEPRIHDLEVATGRSLDDLDLAIADQQLDVYERAIGLTVGTSSADGDGRRVARLKACRLLTNDGRPTNAGYLLFGNGGVARVVITTGAETRELTGNVFTLAQEVQDVLSSDANEPFRLKGPASEEVRLYPPLALKELIVNALVHRDHGSDEPIVVEVHDDLIRISNPGGVVSGLDASRLGSPGVKAYRNPILADILYGVGLMDKAGSGLTDVRKLARDIGGDAMFAPDNKNTKFVATLIARPERPDPLTGTAIPASDLQTFTSNVLPVELVASTVWTAATAVRARADVYDAHPGQAVPAFAQAGGSLYSFTELGASENPLHEHALATPEQLPVAELLRDEDRERILVQLLNSELLLHARRAGLLSVAIDRRLYFPRTDEGPRDLSYQARLRKASRTVTKPIVSRTTNRITYWEHQAVRFSFRRYGADWGLALVPSWVFTRDGLRDVITGPRVGRLATRRSARDYNPQVAGDLTFWAWVLGGGEATFSLGGAAVRITSRFLEVTTNEVPAAEGPVLIADVEVDEDALQNELSELAQEAPVQ